MRDLINLVESKQVLREGHGVDPRNVVLRTCVAIFTGMYWDRRPECRDMGCDDAENIFHEFGNELPAEIRDLPEDEAILTPEFKRLVIKWANARYKNVEKKLNAAPRGKHGLIVTRAIMVPLRKFSNATETGATDLGVHWTITPDLARAIWSKGDGVEVIISGEVQDSHVDWFNTYMANMDFYSGDEEDEIRIKPGSPVHVTSIQTDTGDFIDIDGIRFTA